MYSSDSILWWAKVGKRGEPIVIREGQQQKFQEEVYRFCSMNFLINATSSSFFILLKIPVS